MMRMAATAMAATFTLGMSPTTAGTHEGLPVVIVEEGPVDELREFVWTILLGEGGGGCCSANCLFGTCGTCCRGHELPLCSCELTGQPHCTCV